MLFWAMADEKPITIPNLVAALMEAGFGTKDDLDEKLEELSKKIDKGQHEQRTEFFDGMTKPAINELRKVTEEGFILVDRRLSRLEVDVSAIKDDIKGLKSDL